MFCEESTSLNKNDSEAFDVDFQTAQALGIEISEQTCVCYLILNHSLLHTRWSPGPFCF